MEEFWVALMAIMVLVWVGWPLLRGMRGQRRLCPSCGASYKLGDKFCSRCGHRLPKEGRR